MQPDDRNLGHHMKLRVLLVEPRYRRRLGSLKNTAPTGSSEAPRLERPSDERLWYPPLGLMKLSRFHKQRGDDVSFVSGPDKSLLQQDLLQDGSSLGGRVWDRVYVTTLFTYDWKETVRTIELAKRLVGNSTRRLFVGGVMASLMSKDIWEETGVSPVIGVLNSPSQVGLEGDEDIDLLAPDYSILDPHLYAVNDTYYGYCTRGCVNTCGFCGVPRVEPEFVPYIDIKPVIRQMRGEYGDKPHLKLMDNNVLASPELERIVGDLVELGYGRGCTTSEANPRKRVVDFNQGLDAALLRPGSMELLSRLNVSPMRIAFDRLAEEAEYVRAVELARGHGVTSFSNYMLYNWNDSPRDLYDRLMVNIELNEAWKSEASGELAAAIYSYPMRFAPIDESLGKHSNRQRDFVPRSVDPQGDYIEDAVWTKLFLRNLEVMKGAAHGAISPTPSLARRTIGETYEQFVINLYMPEVLLRNRNTHERRVYDHEPARPSGSGEVEAFREFMLRLLEDGGDRLREFHGVVTQNSTRATREYLGTNPDKEIRKWLQLYLQRG